MEPGCGSRSTRSLSDQLQARSSLAWTGDVTGGSDLAAVGPTGELQYRGPCSLTAFPWAHDKPGGPAR
jgi:hypothetical protein